MSSDSEEDGMSVGRHQSPTSDDELPAAQVRQQAHSSNQLLRPPVGFSNWGGNNQSGNNYPPPPSASSQPQYLPGQAPSAPPSKPTRKSKSKSKSHGGEGGTKKRMRALPQYIPYLPGDPPPETATLAYAGRPDATTFVGDVTQYITNDRNKPPPRAELDMAHAVRDPHKYSQSHYYQPAEKAYVDGKRVVPFYDPLNPTPPSQGYLPGPPPMHHSHHESEQYQDDHISQSSESSGHKKKHRSHRHRDHSDGHLQSRDSQQRYSHARTEYQEPSSSHHHRQTSSTPGPNPPYTHVAVHPPPPPTRPPAAQLRILTLLIEDQRREDERDQLAEIRVPLKAIDDPDGGFWADAKEVCKELQSGPSRIDGPAKAYTRRGKYRQYFLRVTSAGMDEYSSANLRVEKDRTVEVFIEAAPHDPIPMIATQTPRITTPVSTTVSSPRSVASLKRKHDLVEHHDMAMSSPQSAHMQISPSYSHQPFNHPMGDDVVMSPPKKHKTLPPMNLATPVIEHGHTAEWGDSTTAAGSAAQSPRDVTVTALMDLEHPTPSPINQESPKIDPQPERPRTGPIGLLSSGLVTGSESHKHTKTDTAVIQWLKSQIVNEQGWNDFVESRRTSMTVGEQMKHYGYVQSKLDKFVGKKTPEDLEDAAGEIITKTQVVAVFGQPLAWGDTCTETLRLTELYGPGGSRLEDPNVVGMIDQPPPISTGMQVREYLKLLRQIDHQWNSEHGESGY